MEAATVNGGGGRIGRGGAVRHKGHHPRPLWQRHRHSGRGPRGGIGCTGTEVVAGVGRREWWANGGAGDAGMEVEATDDSCRVVELKTPVAMDGDGRALPAGTACP
jgi:hypothetical protein